MKLINDKATIEYLEEFDANQLMNFWYEFRYHPMTFAKGEGSRRYISEMAAYASNLSAFKRCGDTMYKDIADKCAAKARELLAKYEEN